MHDSRMADSSESDPQGGGLHERLLNRLGPDLVAGDLAGATDLRLDMLEERYGVSRSVAREAVRVLESLGLVASRRRVGIIVRPRTDWNVFDPRLIRWRLNGPDRHDQLRSLSELRRGIEPVAAALAAANASPHQRGELTGAAIGMSVTGNAGDLDAFLDHDVRFHTTLLEASGNDMFAGLAGVVAEVLADRTHHRLMPTRPNPVAVRLHGDVAEAIAASEAAQAESAMRDIVVEAQQAMERTQDG